MNVHVASDDTVVVTDTGIPGGYSWYGLGKATQIQRKHQQVTKSR